MMTINKFSPTLVLLLISMLGFSQTVTDQSELDAAISNATAGTIIIVQDGTYSDLDISIDKNGALGNPIKIVAENKGSVFLEGASRAELSGSHIEISGFVFQNPSGLTTGLTSGDEDNEGDDIDPVIRLNDCNYCIVQNIKIDAYNASSDPNNAFSAYSKFKWLLLDGQHNEVRYCSFIGKNGIGSIINDNRNSAEEDFLKIHHNYFADRVPALGLVNERNDQDAIRIGNSETSLDDSTSEVYENYFYNFFGEVEMISNKSGNNKYYNNTFRNYAGSITLRHGNGCEVYGNYFFAEDNIFSAGVRVIGEDHKVYNNYIEGVNSQKDDGSTSNATGGINVTNGRVNTEINGYYQVKNTTIINNTFVNCDYAMRVGTLVKSDLSLEPENLIVANNIMYNTSEDAYQIVTTPSGSSISEGNLTSLSSSDLSDDGNFHRLTSGSAPVGAALGTYSFLIQDILNADRGANFDAGAEEFGASGTRLPFTAADVDVEIGFGAIAPTAGPSLNVNPSNLNYSIDGGALTFNITANVSWSITDDASWLTFDTNSGTDSATITATATANTTGVERTATITIAENAGGDDLETTITVTQSDGTFNPDTDAVEITVDNVTGVGTQSGGENIPENTIDGETTNRWSGESNNGSAYLTFDLGCIHTLTDISISFFNSTERTTTVSIATSIDNNNYTDVFTEVESTELVTEGYEDFDLNLAQAQYIRVYGFGNSDANSDWNSIQEVKFYGNENCNTTLSNEDFESLAGKGVILYPVPVTNGELNIVSSKYKVNNIEIFNMAGQQVIFTEVNNQNNTQVDVSSLTPGVYFIVLDEIGSAKFIVK